MPRIQIKTIESDGSRKTVIIETAFGLEFAKAKYATQHPNVIAIEAEYVSGLEQATSFEGCEFLRGGL